jgi:hypothetical protein
MSRFATSSDAGEWDIGMAETVVWQPLDIDNALQDLGLDRERLLDVVNYAALERSLCTENDAIGFANHLVYDKAGRRLRELYLPRKWVKDDSNNQSAIKNPERRIRVVPCNFNEFAGNRLVTPTNKSPKGEVSRKKSICNATAWLPGIPDVDPETDKDGYLTWLLGIYIDETNPTGAELSLPVAFDGNYFTSFGRRILLISGGEDGARKGVREGDDAVEVVDIAVRRK